MNSGIVFLYDDRMIAAMRYDGTSISVVHGLDDRVWYPFVPRSWSMRDRIRRVKDAVGIHETDPVVWIITDKMRMHVPQGSSYTLSHKPILETVDVAIRKQSNGRT